MWGLQSCFSLIMLSLSFDSAHQNILQDNDLPYVDYNWDMLILSQHWPETSCKMWKYDGVDHHCVFPLNRRWTVHGIWPSNIDRDCPAYCNETWIFVPQEIEPIKEELYQVWTNIFKETKPTSFWAHEWLKHGTCCSPIESLNSQYKYFKKGIDWSRQYPVWEILSVANILPSDTRELTAEELTVAVKAYTNKLPTVACWVNNGIQYLDEVRICFDMQLRVIDCTIVVREACDAAKSIIYPIQKPNGLPVHSRTVHTVTV